MTKPGRIPCCIPHCRRTAPQEKFPDCDEIVCGKHWRRADKKLRTLKTKAHRDADEAAAKCEAIETEGYECAKANGGVHIGIIERFTEAARIRDKAVRRVNRIWERCRKQIIERSFGIG